MPRLHHPLALTAVVLFGATAGCGGPSVDAAALKTQLTGVADVLDRCVAKTNDARKCTRSSALGTLPAGAELGSDVGQITARADRALRYELKADAGDDVTFSVIAQPVGARKRVCGPAGRGDCPAGGAW